AVSRCNSCTATRITETGKAPLGRVQESGENQNVSARIASRAFGHAFRERLVGDIGMNADEIRERVASFSQWHYECDLQGEKRPSWHDGHRNRPRQRVEHCFKPVVYLYGGTLEGKRVLDLGCNAGFWSLEAIRAGADYVHGVDGRQMHVDQANLVFEALEVEPSRYQFEVGNVLTRDFTDL